MGAKLSEPPALRTETDPPRYLQIETTTICNASCSFCPQRAAGRGAEVMSWDLFEKVLADSRHWEGLVYRLYLLNEPLTDPMLTKRIAVVKVRQPKAAVELHSNASLLNEDLAERLVGSGLDTIRFSVDGFAQGTLRRARGLRKRTVYPNILRFAQLNRRAGSPVKVVVRMIRQLARDSDELAEYREFWERRVDEVVFTDLYSCPPHRLAEPVLAPCPKPQHEMFVRADGSVILCCWDWLGVSCVGNAREYSLEVLWHRLFPCRQRLRAGNRTSMQPCSACHAYAGVAGQTSES